ncbi:hypothetical protein WME97_47570 [Sorangium sp. So ce367]|uniref:hypothetical protein n=1 Tax=Sorangium sp. So ce367 TaxID=3133305 RepID=UPI003F6098C1
MRRTSTSRSLVRSRLPVPHGGFVLALAQASGMHYTCELVRWDMFFWNIKALRVALVDGTSSERARFGYLLGFVLLTGAVSLLLEDSTPQNEWDAIATGVNIAVMVLGTIWAYHLNGGDRGHHFIERYVSLSWVYTLRFAVMFMLPVVLAYVVAGLLDLVTDATGPFDVVMGLVMEVAFYVGLGRHMRLTAAAGAEAAAHGGAAAHAAGV